MWPALFPVLLASRVSDFEADAIMCDRSSCYAGADPKTLLLFLAPDNSILYVYRSTCIINFTVSRVFVEYFMDGLTHQLQDRDSWQSL